MRLIEFLKERLNPRTIAKEMDAAVVKAASQGASEVAQALFTGHPYTPYGPTEKPLPVVEPIENYKAELEKLAAGCPRHQTGRGGSDSHVHREPQRRRGDPRVGNPTGETVSSYHPRMFARRRMARLRSGILSHHFAPGWRSSRRRNTENHNREGSGQCC